MSRIPQPGRGVPPKTGAIPRPSRTGVPGSSTTGVQDTSKSTARKCPGPAKEPKKKDREFNLPPLSTMKRVKDEETEVQKLKQKTIRRNAPEGEDIKMIKEIMKGLKDQEITVHEFVGLVAPYTGDNGTTLRTVLAAELAHFRTLARKIYDNMTQDISDVLTNEHIQLTESSKEKHALYGDKMMRAIDEVYEYCPNFNFEKFYTTPNYIEKVFPHSVEAVVEEDREQALLRQEAYHRMMWLRSEGDRLSAENKRLQDRLKELKDRQREEMKRAANIDRQNEDKRKELEKTQEDLQDQLEDVNTSIEKALLDQEIAMGEHELSQAPPPPKVRAPVQTAPKARTRQLENWNVKVAGEIEESTMSEAVIAEHSRVSIASSKSSTGAVPKITKRRKKEKRRPPSVPQDSSPFHYSPPRTPPEARKTQTSPFHYSPPKTPPKAQDQPETLETTRITTTTRTVEQPPPESGLPRARRNMAPRDTWGGFA
ncbi:hypothetical protein MML48_8g00000844 [Holotrichia oblita]|uniref:Uncharacterized protein n=1 Tax=Holotrichia oblita TaxID=644536 RepID=A0ACB9SSG8_HOLOL|nr:hypothetical protein MML48_8g00000844 [Holotrichia oblita]